MRAAPLATSAIAAATEAAVRIKALAPASRRLRRALALSSASRSSRLARASCLRSWRLLTLGYSLLGPRDLEGAAPRGEDRLPELNRESGGGRQERREDIVLAIHF